MSAPQQPAAAAVPQTQGAWPMYRAMVGVGLLCGLLIVTVYQATLPAITRNKAEALQRAIFRVLPDAASFETWTVDADGAFTRADDAADANAATLYVGHTGDGALAGFAIPAQGMGYQDVILVLYGYSAADAAVVGLQVLESKETPGLGDRIETDAGFVANFEKLDASLTADGTAIAHPIVAVKHGEKHNAWEIDGITGATISSHAIADILAASTARWAPLIRANLARLTETG
ncbi:FMN-binding protein [bacterium]|nr:FMN-binding protein [bacterium]